MLRPEAAFRCAADDRGVIIVKAGFNKLDVSVDETWQIDEDTPAAVGKFHITGKNDKGEAVDAEGVWSAAYVKQDGGWKIRMLTASVKPPPAK